MNSTESNASILNAFDFRAIDEMDPSLAEGHKLIYEREVPFELRIQEGEGGPQEVGTLEAIKVKILIIGDEGNAENVKVELTSENDMFFHYTHSLIEDTFKVVQEDQKLMIEFPDYPNILIKMLNSCIKEPHSYLAVFIMQRDGSARLDFIQNMEYKFVELLSMDFNASSEEIIRQQITFRYNSVKSKLAIMQARLQDINAIVKIKNPSLLLQLQKQTPSKANRSVMRNTTSSFT
ncbi:unnamed protein product [Moneuplotes crassus]|uniref:Spindle assembly abnormal protein 6 N-terminal domain-containing protein n=1 Tax=Euplotes crassus TaxID=5936 RepID=A0AAD2D3Y1_EUPCR|nr:unnamed protein product [Moneuplotes crassus]